MESHLREIGFFQISFTTEDQLGVIVTTDRRRVVSIDVKVRFLDAGIADRGVVIPVDGRWTRRSVEKYPVPKFTKTPCPGRSDSLSSSLKSKGEANV